MSLKIRLAKTGRKGKSLFRIVVMPTRSKRNGQVLDNLGTYDETTNPPNLKLDQAKLANWQKKGAQVSVGLRKILPPEADKPARGG